MAVRPILHWPDPRLAQRCAQVLTFDPALVKLGEDLLESMYDARGRGLAAPQVGVMQQVFVVDTAWKEGSPKPMLFVNPVIRQASAETEEQVEGCLSIPDCPLPVRRPAQIVLDWHDHAGRDCTGTFEGIEATCIQHELDHLHGVLILDRAAPQDLAGIAGPLAALRASA